MKDKFATTTLAVILLAASVSTGYGRQQQGSTAAQQKIEALDDAFRNGLLTQQEYDAKVRALKKAAALKDALNNGLLTPEEYRAKLNALNVARDSGSAGQGNGEAAPVDFGPMKTVEVMDPLFNMVAETLQIPASWNFEGTVIYLPGCEVPTYTLAMRAYSPDMLYGFQLTPKLHFYSAEDSRALPHGPGPDCKALPPISAADFGNFYSIRMRSGSEVDSVEPAPEEAEFKASVEGQNPELAARAAARGFSDPPVNRGEMKRLHIHYDLNGHAEEEYLNVRMAVWDRVGTFPVYPRGQVMRILRGHHFESVASVVGLRAPQGQLQAYMALYEAIGKSIKVNQEQVQRPDAYMTEIVNRNIAASWAVHNSMMQQNAAQMAANSANAQNFINNMNTQFANHEAYINNSNAQFNAHQATVLGEVDRRGRQTQDVCDHILNQQYFVNPTTGQTTTQSNQYNHTYSNGSGNQTILQTNSGTNPNAVLPGYWNELQPIHH